MYFHGMYFPAATQAGRWMLPAIRVRKGKASCRGACAECAKQRERRVPLFVVLVLVLLLVLIAQSKGKDFVHKGKGSCPTPPLSKFFCHCVPVDEQDSRR
jgi:predicted nucleic acid-binding Zn ribbon protein